MIARALAFAVALLLAGPAMAAPPNLVATSRLELVPDTDGTTRARVAHGLRLGVRLAPGWRFDLVGAARFGGAFGVGRLAELNRIAVRYDSPGLSVSVGRVASPGTIGTSLLDGVVLGLRSLESVVVGRVWFGHAWHPELGLPDMPNLAGGGEVHLRPHAKGGGRGPISVVLGGSLRGAGAAPEGRLWTSFEGINGRGGLWGLGVEGGLGAPGTLPVVPLRAHARVRGPVSKAVDLGAELRWEGLPRIGIPMRAPSALELLAPDGYGVARFKMVTRIGPVHLDLTGGPTVQPVLGRTVRAGGITRLSGSIPVGKLGHVGALAVVAGFGRSLAGGGGASGTIVLGRFDASLEATLLRFVGLDHSQGWVGEVRARAGVLLPPPIEHGPSVRILGQLAGGADRVLLASIRGGLAVEVVMGKPAEIRRRK